MGRIGPQTFVEHKGDSCFMLGRVWREKSVGFVAAMDGHSPVTNPCTKSYSVCPPEEYLLEQCAVKMQSADVNKGQT